MAKKSKVLEARNNGGVADKLARDAGGRSLLEERQRRRRFFFGEIRRRAAERRESGKEHAAHSCGEATSNCEACRQVASEAEAGESRTPEVVVFAEAAPEGTSGGARAWSASRGDGDDPSRMSGRVVEVPEHATSTDPTTIPLDDLANKGASKGVLDRDASSSVSEDEASRGGAPAVVVAGTVSISLRYHHEALLRASASCVIDAVVAEEAAYGIFRAYSNRKELGEGDASPLARGDTFGDVLRRRLDYARQRGADEGFAWTIVSQLVAALKVVESRADLFARDYAAASRELGTLAAHDFVKAMDKDYRKLGDDHHYRVGLWGKFLGLVASRGVVVELLGADLCRGAGVEGASYRGDAEYLMRLEEILGRDVRQAPSWRRGAASVARDLAMRLLDGDAGRGVGREE